jgi:L-iditol 2-dehydrogenase
MKAWVLHDIGDIRYEEVPQSQPAAGEVLVRVGAAGICGSDIPRIYDTGAHRMPLIPGHEFAGTVEAVSEDIVCKEDKANACGIAGVDETWIGKRVGIFPLIPCRKCPQCQSGHYELCRNYDYLGSRSDGAFAEYVCVPEANLIELPDSVSMEEAAMLEPMAVAVHAIRQAIDLNDADRSKRIAVYGLGTIGLFAVMFLKSEGFNDIIAIGNKESRKNKVMALGIEEERYFDSRKTDMECGLSDSANIYTPDRIRADITFECVGKPETLEASVAITNPMGTVVTVGNPHSDMTLKRDIYWKILRNQLTLKGTWNSSFSDDWHYVIDKLKDKAIDPAQFISHRFSLKDLDKGLAIMKNKSEDYGKIMINRNMQEPI